MQLSQAQKCQAATHCMSAAHASAAVAQLVASSTAAAAWRMPLQCCSRAGEPAAPAGSPVQQCLKLQSPLFCQGRRGAVHHLAGLDRPETTARQEPQRVIPHRRLWRSARTGAARRKACAGCAPISSFRLGFTRWIWTCRSRSSSSRQTERLHGPVVYAAMRSLHCPSASSTQITDSSRGSWPP